MSDPTETPAVQPPPKLPEVDSPPAEKVLDGVPSTDAVVEEAETAGDIVDRQPTVDEILGR